MEINLFFRFLLFALIAENEATTLKLSKDVQQLFDDYWNWRLVDKPQFATFVGINDYDNELDDLSEQAYENRYNTTLTFLERVAEIEPTLTEEDDITNVQVLKRELIIFRDGFPYKGFYFPVSHKEGPHLDYINLLGWMPLETLDDYNIMLSRMTKIPNQMDQMATLMANGVQNGLVFHDISMKNLDASFQEYIVTNGEESPFYSLFEDSFPPEFNASTIEKIQNDAIQIIVEDLVPAYEKMLNFIQTSYPTRSEIGVTSLPNGVALYNQLILYHTSTNYTADEIHNIGLNEVENIEIEMAQIIRELGYNMSVSEFSAMIRDDPNSYYSSEEELLSVFNDVAHNVISPKIPLIFNYYPAAELEIVADPNGNGGFYYAGSYDGSRPGVFYVGTQDINNQPNYTVISLSLHEGNPGHHLQASFDIESSSLPLFRKVSDDREYNQRPSSFPLNTDYVEGWGLYSESLGKDMDLYGNPLDKYGQLSDEIFRATRLVVDTGLHALGWTRQQAIDFMLLHTASAQGDIEAEVDRYITWPGQALGYKMGELRLQEIRKNAETQLGDSFDIKGFHDVILSSSGSLDIAEAEVDKWIESLLSTPQ